MKNKALRIILSKSFIFSVLVVVQIIFMMVAITVFADKFAFFYTLITIFSALLLIGILEKDDLNPAYKLMWIVLIVVLPFAGVLFYVIFGQRRIPKRMMLRFEEAEDHANAVMDAEKNEETLAALRRESHRLYQSARYLNDLNGAPLYVLDTAEYYPLGQDFYPPFLEALRGAKRYIFLHYYIWNEGQMLSAIVDILKEKAAAGVDVRIIHDGFGTLITLTQSFWNDLKCHGIKVSCFAPIVPTIHLTDYGMLNHRDHRKLTVVDGSVAFSGGLNIADEYFNLYERFGEWKDTTFKITGGGVFSMASTFLRTWDYINGTKSDYEAFRGNYRRFAPEEMNLARGYVQPYWDCPLDDENVSENAYLNIIRHATEYVYISTPYLVLDQEMITNLSLAAKSGVDVRILTPGIPDKRLVFLVTRSYYAALIRSGVKIYEYSPGFNHAKMFVSDDREAVVGSANMDFRSLYLHFENGAFFYGGRLVCQVKADMLACMAKSREMTIEAVRLRSPVKTIMQRVARFFGPLM